MRILVLSPYFPPEGGGLENYAFSMVEELVSGNDIYVLTLSRKFSGLTELDLGGDRRATLERIRARFVLSNTPLSLRFLLRAFSLVKNWKPDLIVAHTPVPFAADAGALVSWLFGIPLVVVYHTVGLKKGSSLDLLASLYIKIFERFLLSNASKIISVSPAVRDYLRSQGFESVVIPPRPKRTLVNISFNKRWRKEKVVLFVGQLSTFHRFKNFDVLLEAFSRLDLQDWELWVVGSGDLLEYYRKLASNLGVVERVRFFGALEDPEKLAEIYGKASILVLPSSFESFGLVALEGFIFGDVVVVTENVAKNLCILGLGADMGIVSIRQTSELHSVLNELVTHPKTLKKVCPPFTKRKILERLLRPTFSTCLFSDNNPFGKF